jgi:multisubunit Na+/H+ antiporter MnhE subunit
MSLWLLFTDTLSLAELLAGAGASAISATLAEVVQHQTDTHFRMRIEWLVPALRLPVEVVHDTAIVFGALWAFVARGKLPDSGFHEVPKQWGGESAEGVTRRALTVVGTSAAPNSLVLGIDRDRQVMVVHHLVPPPAGTAE